MSGKKSLQQVLGKAIEVIAVLAQHGHESIEGVHSAFEAGAKALGATKSVAMPKFADWSQALDSALPDLDRLKPSGKQTLIHVPLPMISADETPLPE